MVSISGSAVVVTGAASGIGRSIVTEFATEGASVLAVDVDEDGLADLVNDLGADQPVETVVGDITDQTQVEAMVDEAVDRFGTIDVLCNNAGVHDDSEPAGEASESLWDRTIDVNLKGMFLLTKAALPPLQEGDDEGVVVNTASLAGKAATGGGAAYTSSKHGVIGFTRQLCQDYAPDIRPNAICPGFVESGMTEEIIEEDPQWVDQMTNEKPAGRPGTPRDISRVVVFLASDDASFMYGSAVDVDGGWLAVND